MQLCLCIVSNPFSARAASLETTAESTTESGIHQHRAAALPLPTSHSFGTILPHSLLSSHRGLAGAAGPGQGKEADAAAQLCHPHREGLYPKIASLETRRVQESRRRESPSLHPFPIAGKGGRPLILGAGLPGGQALPLPLPVAPARAEDLGLPGSAVPCRDPKAELGQTHFSRQTCSHLKAEFSFSISDTEHSSSGPHQRPFPGNPRESGRKGPLGSTAIPCLPDTGTAARDHRPLLGPYDTFQKSRRRQAGGEVRDAGSPLRAQELKLASRVFYLLLSFASRGVAGKRDQGLKA